MLLAVFTAALDLVFIPFHAPDDIDHFERAYLLANGQVWPEAVPGQHSGGRVDVTLQRYVEAERPAIHHWPREGGLTAPLGPDAATRRLGWSGETSLVPFGAAAITYFPAIYLPQTVAIWLGRGLDLSIEQTVLLARALNGAATLGVVFAGLSAWPVPAALIGLLFVLPKTLLHLASNSPDPLAYALMIVAIGLLCRGRVRWAAAILLLVCPVRPQAAALAIPGLVAAWRGRDRWGALLIVGAVLLAAGWTGAILASTVSDACAGSSAPLGMRLLDFARHGWLLVPATLWERGRYLLVSFVGELGWGYGPEGRADPLPGWIYPAALMLLPVAAATDAATPFALPRVMRGAFGVAAVVAAGIVFLALAVTCAGGDGVIQGVQGRYFVPVLLCLVPVISGTAPERRAWRPVCAGLLCAFGLAGFVMLMGEGLRIYWMR